MAPRVDLSPAVARIRSERLTPRQYAYARLAVLAGEGVQSALAAGYGLTVACNRHHEVFKHPALVAEIKRLRGMTPSDVADELLSTRADWMQARGKSERIRAMKYLLVTERAAEVAGQHLAPDPNRKRTGASPRLTDPKR